MTIAADERQLSAAESQMCAVVLNGSQQQFQYRRRPVVHHGHVTVRVHSIGLCRTDLSVIDGSLKVSYPLVPGHEFSGTICQIGEGVSGLHKDQIVAVNPLLPCHRCSVCEQQRFHKCPHLRMMGVDVDGACCEETELPADRVFPVPLDLSFAEAAMAEPVAAVLAVADVPLISTDVGIILGDNRIAVLTQRVLQSVKSLSPEILSPSEANFLPDNSMDYVIESQLTGSVLQSAIRILRPGGTLIVKSRQQGQVSLDTLAALRKEILIRFAHYGSFQQAVDLLARRAVVVDDLIGRQFLLNEFSEAIAWARRSETRKTFLKVGDP